MITHETRQMSFEDIKPKTINKVYADTRNNR